MPDINKPNLNFGAEIDVNEKNSSSHQKAAKKKKKKKVKKFHHQQEADILLANEINRISSEKDDFEFTVIGGGDNDARDNE